MQAGEATSDGGSRAARRVIASAVSLVAALATTLAIAAPASAGPQEEILGAASYPDMSTFQ